MTFFIILSLRYWRTERDQYDEVTHDVTKEKKKEGTHFASEHESSNEDPLTRPTLGSYPEVGLRSLDIDEGDEDDCGADPGRADHPPHELSEPAVFFLAVAGSAIER